MNKIKNIFTIMIAMLLVISSQATFATEYSSLDEASKAYGFKDVEVIPEGVVPLEINSVEELDEFIENIENMEISVTGAQNANNSKNIDSEHLILPLASARATDTCFLTFSIPGSLPLLKPDLTLEVSYNASAGSVTQINYYGWDVSGATVGVSLSSEKANASYSGSVISATGSTNVDYYLLIEGGYKVLTDKYTASFDYNVKTDKYSNVKYKKS